MFLLPINYYEEINIFQQLILSRNITFSVKKFPKQNIINNQKKRTRFQIEIVMKNLNKELQLIGK